MTIELVAILVLICALVVVLFAYRGQKDLVKQQTLWLSQEMQAHERTRETLHQATARMRRATRERFLGIIESNQQRGM